MMPIEFLSEKTFSRKNYPRNSRKAFRSVEFQSNLSLNILTKHYSHIEANNIKKVKPGWEKTCDKRKFKCLMRRDFPNISLSDNCLSIFAFRKFIKKIQSVEKKTASQLKIYMF